MDTHPNTHTDASDHQKTYNGFIRFLTRSAIACVVFLIVLALFNA